MHALSATASPATTAEIERIIGTKNGHVLNDIRRIGPTLEEVCEAYGCLDAPDRLQALMERRMHPRTRKVFLLLKQSGPRRQTGCCGACA